MIALSFFYAAGNLGHIYFMTCFHFHHFLFDLSDCKDGEVAANFFWDSWNLILSDIVAFESSFLR